jgi:hypothetical protein
VRGKRPQAVDRTQQHGLRIEAARGGHLVEQDVESCLGNIGIQRPGGRSLGLRLRISLRLSVSVRKFGPAVGHGGAGACADQARIALELDEERQRHVDDVECCAAAQARRETEQTVPGQTTADTRQLLAPLEQPHAVV